MTRINASNATFENFFPRFNTVVIEKLVVRPRSLPWAFGEAAVIAKRNHPLITPYAERLVSKHGKFKGNSILANQLARTVYYMLKTGTPFDPENMSRG